MSPKAEAAQELLESDGRPQDGYREMLILDLIAEYGPMYPEDAIWDETAQYLYDSEPELMATLTESLRVGGWREPILLSVPDDLVEGTSPKILDGTHRVVIALQEGVISVPVATRRELPAMSEEPRAELTIKLKAGQSPLEEGEEWRLTDLLRSFPLNGDIWLNSDVAWCSKNSYSFCYELKDSAQFPELKRKVQKMVKEAFPGFAFSIAVALEDLDR